MKIENELITPEKATRLLSNNTGNRQVSRRHVSFLKEQMLKGKWEAETGEMIKVAENGRLLDGQHRLEALVLSGTSQTMLIGYGFDEKIFNVIDTGKNRTAADLISMNGYKNATQMHAMARFVLLYQKNIFHLSQAKNIELRISNQEILEFINKYDEMSDILNHMKPIYKKMRTLSPSSLGGLYLLMSQSNQAKCDDFFNKFATGLDLTSKHPIYVLRERFIRESNSPSKSTTIRDKVATFIKAWNAFMMNKNVSYTALTYHKDENFPTIL